LSKTGKQTISVLRKKKKRRRRERPKRMRTI
jgi:hypothetical protein